MENFNERYSELESDVEWELQHLIIDKGKESKHGQFKSIPVNVFDYTELAIVDDGSLTFLDSNGHHYSLYADCTIEDLIDICVKHNIST